jgi:hypothetical protein
VDADNIVQALGQKYQGLSGAKVRTFKSGKKYVSM